MCRSAFSRPFLLVGVYLLNVLAGQHIHKMHVLCNFGNVFTLKSAKGLLQGLYKFLLVTSAPP